MKAGKKPSNQRDLKKIFKTKAVAVVGPPQPSGVIKQTGPSGKLPRR